MTAPSPWFVCLEPVDEPVLRLFCIPHAGGAAGIYRSWRGHLPQGVELWSLRLPGREIRYREPPFHRLSPLVDALAVEFAPRVDVPFALFGHSLGALTAYELGRRLERDGHPPAHVFVSAHRAPQLPPSHVPVHLAPDDVLLARLRAFGGTPEGFYEDADLVAALLPNLRRDFAVTETYRYDDAHPRLAAPLSAYGGRGDSMSDDGSIHRWSDVVEGPFDVELFDGGHFYWFADPEPLLRSVSRVLAPLVAGP